MKKQLIQCLSIILCFSIIIFPVNAQDAVIDNSVITDDSIINPIDMVPSFLDLKADVTSKFVSRLPEYESTADTIGFLNKDGTRTIYVFPYDIRYKNDNGDMLLYDQTIVPITSNAMKTSRSSIYTNFDYENKSSDIKVYFNDCITENYGVLVEKEEIQISLKINEKHNSTNGVVCKDNASQHSMKYPNAFGNGTYVEYMPTDYGVKEDIVLSSYNGDNTFEFELNTHGLVPEINEAGAVLFMDGNKEIVGMIAPIFAYDSSISPKYDYDHDVILSCVEYSKYLLKYTINEDFLTDKDTVYPVTIDPSIDLSIPSDAPVYSKYTSANYQANPTSCVGYNSTWGTGRAYFSIDLSSINNIKPEEIFFAQLSLRETTGSTASAQVYVHEVTSPWSASSITYGNQPSFNSSAIASFNANSANNVYWYYIDITDTVMSWQKYGGNYGVMLKAATDTTSYWRAFAKSNYSTTSMRPYLTIYTYSRDTRSWGSIGSNGARGAVIAGSNVHITFTVPSTATYYIETAQPNAPNGVVRDTKLYLYNSAGTLLTSSDDINGSNNRYSRIQSSLSPGTYTVWFVEYGYPYNVIDYVAAYVTIWAKNSLIAQGTSSTSCYSQPYANFCMDFIKLGNGGSYDDDGSYNCLAYAIDKNATSPVWPWWGNPTPAQSKSYLESLGYTASTSSSSTCIVDYIDASTGRVTHYARIDNGVVTAKCGEWEKMQHSSYDPYFEQSYGDYNMFYKK